MLESVLVILLLSLRPGSSALILARRIKAGECIRRPICMSISPLECDRQMKAGQTACAGVAVLKVPRTGSTWLTKELRGFPGMQLEFEPFTDGGSGTQCGGRFFTQAVTRALHSRLRCVTREFRARPCYWAWQHCNASRLQPRQMSTRTVVVGFLLNPMYTPGVKWEVAMSLAPRARLIWLRRTNLVKMALSDLRRLAVISSHRHAEPKTASRRLQEKSGNISQLARVDPEELLVKINSSLVSQASFPAGLPLEQALLVLYEDMQTHRVLVLRTILRFLGVESIPEIKSEIERQEHEERRVEFQARTQGGAVGKVTHWMKASEDVCAELSESNCGELHVAFRHRPCLLAQLKSRLVVAWSFPNLNGTLSISTLDGSCVQLKPLDTIVQVDKCTSHRRSLFELYDTWPPERSIDQHCKLGHRVHAAQSHLLRYSQSRETWPTKGDGALEMVRHQVAGASSQPLGGSSSHRAPRISPYNRSVVPDTSAQSGRTIPVPEVRMVHPWRRMRYNTSAARLRAEDSQEMLHRAAGNVRFIIFSRQRSASTTFVGLLNLHPNITCRWESFSNSFTAEKMRAYLGFSNRSEQHEHIPEFMARFWDACPTRACGFKILHAQVRPLERLHQLFSGTVQVRRILLERKDVNAEFESWQRAQNTGNWGTTPEAQAKFSAAIASNMSANYSQRTGCKGCGGAALAKNMALAQSMTKARFVKEHRVWFRTARELRPAASSPLLHIFSEDLITDLLRCNETMTQVYAFLQLPSLPNNCDTAKVPVEWQCNIETDERCSMEKYSQNSNKRTQP